MTDPARTEQTGTNGAAGPWDRTGDDLVGPAAELVRRWLNEAESALTRSEQRVRRRLAQLTGDPRSVEFTMAFCDRVIRPDSDAVAASQLRQLVEGPLPGFLSPVDRVLLVAGATLSTRLPSVVMPLARRRLRRIVGALVADRADPGLGSYMQDLSAAGFDVNTNLLGEYVLGEDEAASRLAAIVALLDRPDVSYVSVKASAVASQLELWGYAHSLRRVKDRLRVLFRAAALAPAGPKFVNLDMEEYRDLGFTVDSFTELLDEPEFTSFEAGIALQAYLPDSFDVLRRLGAWAGARRGRGGASIKVRVVKGANLAMETVDSELHGWARAPYPSKADSDANFKRMLDWALVPDRVDAVRIGVASHNLFDVAWARLLAQERGVAEGVDFEMLQGMAVGIDRAVRDATGRMVLYTPIVSNADFDTALAYLFRRLEENAGGENFLHAMFRLTTDPELFAAEQAKFATAVGRRWQVASGRRRDDPLDPRPGFTNTLDTDPTDQVAREAIVSVLGGHQPTDLPDPITNTSVVDAVVLAAERAAPGWAVDDPIARRVHLRRVAGELSDRRPQLIATMVHEANKTIAEADSEVSEAIDFANYYAEHVPGLDADVSARFTPLGTVLITPPWNFPVAIPAGGVLAALAAGNCVILKPAPETPRCSWAVVQACWAAGVPREVVQFVRGSDQTIGSHLVAHLGIHGIILTGAVETAELFHKLAPTTPLFAETSGKNAIIVMPDADLDLAAADVIKSAFGHAGQKCSAASLAICVGDTYRSANLRRRLVDAARSLVAGSAGDPATMLAPLIGDPSPKLARALATLDPGEHWLLEPRLIDADSNLWSPGIKDGVASQSWFHQTECFGPVLGLMAADDLDQAIALQNGTRFGLTGGIHTLDPANIERWLAAVQVGNAYVNRVITGAVVQRQPFGGWKRSSIGPGAKAGGPNYVGQFGHWSDGPLPTLGRSPSKRVTALVEPILRDLGGSRREWLDASLASDAYWHDREFSVTHDPTRLACESNIFRYRAVGRIVVRIESDARPLHAIRAIAAAESAGGEVVVSAAPDAALALDAMRETSSRMVDRLREDPVERVRVVGSMPPELRDLEPTTFVDARPVVADGRVEGLRYRREQTISATMHRFGNLVGHAPGN